MKPAYISEAIPLLGKAALSSAALFASGENICSETENGLGNRMGFF